MGGWQPNITLDVMRDRSSPRSWSPGEEEDSYEDDATYPTVSFLSHFGAIFGHQYSKCCLSQF